MNNKSISKEKVAFSLMGIIIILLVCVIVLLIINGNKKENSTNTNKKTTTTKEVLKANIKENVIKDQTVDSFAFTDAMLIYQNGTSTFSVKVTNTSSTPVELNEFKIKFLNEDGSEIVELPGFVGTTIGAGEYQIVTSSFGDDLSEAYEVKYVIE